MFVDRSLKFSQVILTSYSSYPLLFVSYVVYICLPSFIHQIFFFVLPILYYSLAIQLKTKMSYTEKYEALLII